MSRLRERSGMLAWSCHHFRRPGSLPARSTGVGLALLLLLAPSAARPDDPFWAMYRGDGHMFEPTVGVGPTMIIQAANFRVTAYDRTGQEQWRACLNNDAEWEPPGFSDNYFWEYPDGTALPGNGGADVRVLYDQFAGRFVLMSMSCTVDPDRAALYLAISKDSTASDHDHTAWDKFYLDDVHLGDPEAIFHYPGLAVDQQVIYVSAALGNNQHVLQIVKRPPPPPWQYDPNFYRQNANHRKVEIPVEGTDPMLLAQHRLPMPAHFFGTMAPDTLYLVQLADYGYPGTERARMRFTGATVEPTGIPELVQHTVEVEIPGQKDPLSRRQLCPGMLVQCWWNIQNVVWRDGRLYFARIHHKSDGYPGDSPKRYVAHWYVVDTHNWPHGNSVPQIIEDGVVDAGRIFINDNPLDDRPVHIIYPLVMPTAPGDVVIFFSRFHAYGYMDLCFTARRAQDPPGVLGAGVHRMTGGAAGVSNPSHWGDYEGIALDPENVNRVWATGETGRCTPEIECTRCEDGGERQGFFHTVIGSYTIPQEPAHTLTIRYCVDGPPPLPDCHVKVRPPDAGGQADVVLTEAVPTQTRLYGHGTVVILRAPDLSGQGLQFDRWDVGPAPAGPSQPRQINVTMSSDLAATAWYSPQ